MADVLPGATVIDLRGEFNEDWLRTLRIQCVLSAADEVLFDVAEGHDERRVEDAVDEANAEYLDLLDVTGDLYGRLQLAPAGSPPRGLLDVPIRLR